VEADGPHFRRDVALGVERVERILEIGVESVAGVEALRRRESHVVRVERVGRDQLRPAWSFEPIGQIIRIRIAIERAALLHASLMVLSDERP
jgi:hypothetical protein